MQFQYKIPYQHQITSKQHSSQKFLPTSYTVGEIATRSLMEEILKDFVWQMPRQTLIVSIWCFMIEFCCNWMKYQYSHSSLPNSLNSITPANQRKELRYGWRGRDVATKGSGTKKMRTMWQITNTNQGTHCWIAMSDCVPEWMISTIVGCDKNLVQTFTVVRGWTLLNLLIPNLVQFDT